jgi:two-component system nitrate/nitrite response regulator NarL
MRNAVAVCEIGPVVLRCLIVDDHVPFLRAAEALLAGEGTDVVGVASTGAEAERLAAELDPSVVLVDIELGDEDGLDLAARLARGAGDPAVVLISARAEDDLLEAIAASPAVGFLPKSRISTGSIRALVGDRAG